MKFREIAAGLCVSTASAVLAGCATVFPPPTDAQLTPGYQFYSAGFTGCQPKDNVVFQIGRTDMGDTWQATCRGKTYFCTSSRYSGNACAPLAQ